MQLFVSRAVLFGRLCGHCTFSRGVLWFLPIAMPRVRCTPEEEVANLNRRATETANKSMKRSIEIGLKNKPSIIKPLYDNMMSLGVSESNLTVREDVPPSQPRPISRGQIPSKRSRLGRSKQRMDYLQTISSKMQCLRGTGGWVPFQFLS